MSTRLLALFVDALDSDLVDEFGDDCPTLQGLMQTGASGTLWSTDPPDTAVAFPVLYMGVSPETHGLSNRKVHRGFRFVAPLFWRILERHGWSVCCADLPLTYPAQRVRGRFVSGWPCPAGTKHSAMCTPGDLSKNKTVQEHLHLREWNRLPEFTGHSYDRYDDKVRDLVGILDARTKMFEFLASGDEDMKAFCWTAVDRHGHWFQRGAPKWDVARDQFRNVYKEVDARLQRVIQAAQPEHIWVASDHGFGPIGRKFPHHRPQGFWCLGGRGVAPGKRVDIDIIDMLPTVLELVGVAPSMYSHLEGASRLGEVECSQLTDDEQEDLLQQMRNLGYA